MTVIAGTDNWNTGKVTDMSFMFDNTGKKGNTMEYRKA